MRSGDGNQTSTLQVFADVFFSNSCCWIKCLSQQEHGVLLTSKWHWGTLDDKTIGTRQKHIGVSALFYHHCLLCIPSGVTLICLNLTQDGSFPIPSGFSSYSPMQGERQGLAVCLVKQSVTHNQS